MKCYFYLRHPTGELISRLENDVNLTEVFASHLLVSLINEALMVVYTLSAIAVLNVYLAFGVFAVFSASAIRSETLQYPRTGFCS
jgi:ABC-type multidrug transport system, ATPase and permease components